MVRTWKFNWKFNLLLVTLLTFSLQSYAPIKVKNTEIGVATLEDKRIELEIKILKTKKLKLLHIADSVGLSILNQYQRKKSDKQHALFIKKVKEVSKKLDIHFSWLVGIMHHESRLNHKALNSIRAVGLIQFLPSTARGLGTTTNELYNMSGVQQLDYVYKFYKHAKGHLNEATDLYLYAFFPIAVLNNWSDNRAIKYKKLSASKIASQNPGLDLNKNGIVTVGEVRKEAHRHCYYKMRKTKKRTKRAQIKNKTNKIPIIMTRDIVTIKLIKPLEIRKIELKINPLKQLKEKYEDI